eukprot:CAMPEP_0113591838 /NCGR_PEP_ID=MMETSP0015_2-20120614/37497_1 /TAXON_ID=2838 /ORGANISM="Odontella" /LENGTH=582 /DNA_ID=CAMNT_0000498275 /DNA_START=279 /DNA_END=2028 /DNA_ORIENTATION=+ /assembly_acc=CAM_ASM_000160
MATRKSSRVASKEQAMVAPKNRPIAPAGTPSSSVKAPSSGAKRSAATPSSAVRSSSKAATPSSAGSASTTATAPGKANKGLRHLSMRVCKKVEEKGRTSYNGVADELVREFIAERKIELQQERAFEAEIEARARAEGRPPPPKKKKRAASERGYDEKNIRRRVYDALNVLMAMDIISKEKKQITWKGLPSNAHHDLELLQRERAKRAEEVQRKTGCLKELLEQVVCFRNLCRRNRAREEEAHAREADRAKREGSATAGSSSLEGGNSSRLSSSSGGPLGGGKKSSGASKGRDGPPPPIPSPSSTGPRASGGGAMSDATRPEGGGAKAGEDEERIALPFIVVNTSNTAIIQCEMSPDRTDVMFDFSQPFEINDDNEILKRLGLGTTTMEDLQQLLPPDLFAYTRKNRLLDEFIVPAKTSAHPSHPGGTLGIPAGYPPAYPHSHHIQGTAPPVSYPVGAPPPQTHSRPPSSGYGAPPPPGAPVLSPATHSYPLPGSVPLPPPGSAHPTPQGYQGGPPPLPPGVAVLPPPRRRCIINLPPPLGGMWRALPRRRSMPTPTQASARSSSGDGSLSPWASAAALTVKS